MTLTRRERWILRQLSSLRRVHSELEKPLQWSALKTVIQRCGLKLKLEPISRPAMLLATGFGQWSIIVNHDAPRRRHPYYAAHELGHFLLHVEGDGPGKWEVCYRMDDDWPDDPNEDEAEFFATAVLEGPRAAVTRWADGDRSALPRDLRSSPAITLPDPAERLFERLRGEIESAGDHTELDYLRSIIQQRLTWHAEAGYLLELVKERKREIDRDVGRDVGRARFDR